MALRPQNPLHGLSNLLHGNLPWNSPPAPAGPNHALPAQPNRLPIFLKQPLQGSSSSLNVGSSNMKMPSTPPLNIRYKEGRFDSSGRLHDGPVYRLSGGQPYIDLLHGSFGYNNPLKQAVPLNPKYYQDEFPMQSYLPIYRGAQR